MLPEPKKRYPLILDVGCGRGNSFELLDKYFNPDQISGIEIDERLLGDAKKQVDVRRCSIDLIMGNNVGLPPILSFDQSEL